MVWLTIATCTKVLAALIASDSIVGHVLCCLSGYKVAFIIFLILNDLSRQQLHDISTLTAYETWIKFDNLHSLCDFNLIFLLWSEVPIEFKIMDQSIAFGTLDLFVV